MLLKNDGNKRNTQPHITPDPSQASASTRRIGTPSNEDTSRSLAIARIAVPVAVVFRNTLTTMTTKIANSKAMIWVELTTAPHTRKSLVGKTSERGFDVSQRSFMIPRRNKATPTIPSDLTSGSRRASFGAIHMPYRRVSAAHTA